jgi:glycosyltransferase involved in cell wall biosynthesis
MKLALVSRKFDKESGSAEWIYAQRLYEELIKQKISVHKIEQRARFKKKLMHPIHDWTIIPLKILYLRFFKKVKIFHFLSENQAIYSFLVRIIGGKSISTFHDLLRLHKNKSFLDYHYFRLIYKLASLSNKIICNSSFTEQDLLKNYSVQKNKIRIIPCVHYSSLSPNFANRKYIGYLGSLVPRKRVEILIELAILLKKEKSPYTLHIWGQGILEENLRIRIEEEDLKNINLKGAAPYSKINSIYNSFKYFVFPTSYEGLGLPIIEAGVCGVPVFLAKDSIIPMEVKKLGIAYENVLDLYKKIKSLDKNYLKKCEKILKKTKQFDFENNIKKTLEVYYK